MLERKRVVKLGVIVLGIIAFIASVIGAFYVIFAPYKLAKVAEHDTYTIKAKGNTLILMYDLDGLDLMGKKEYSVEDKDCNFTVIEYEDVRRIGRVYHTTVEKEVVYLPKDKKVQEGTEICYNAYNHEYANQYDVQVFPKWLIVVCEIYCCIFLILVAGLVLSIISLVTGVDIDFRRFHYR